MDLRSRVLVPVLRSILRSRLRGSTRIAILAGHLGPLRVHGEDGSLFLDTRVRSTHGYLLDRDRNTHLRLLIRRLVREGQIAFDIGAHAGMVTCLLAKLVGPTGRVFAFEPNPAMLPALRLTVAELPNTTLLEHAIGEVNDAAVRFYVPADEAMTSIADWTHAAQYSFTTASRRLDDVVARGVPHPDFIKCDTEGSEASVFRGAEHLLTSDMAPAVLFEANPRALAGVGDSVAELIGLFADRGFRVLKIGPDGHLRRHEDPIARTTDLLAITPRRAAELELELPANL